MQLPDNYVGKHSLDDIMLIEGGQATQDEYIDAFQRLHDSGLAYQLQGWYGREARRLIDSGLISE